MNIVADDDSGFEKAVAALRRGEVVAYPTETVYGLGVDPFQHSALHALYRVKARVPANPVLIVIGAYDQLEAYTEHVGEKTKRCIDEFWPGPLSLLFPARNAVPATLKNKAGEICIRWTSHRIATRLANEFGGGITSTSANRSGEAPAVSLECVPMDGVSVGIDGGECEGIAVSTVYNAETNTIFREGAVTRAQLDQLLGNT